MRSNKTSVKEQLVPASSGAVQFKTVLLVIPMNNALTTEWLMSAFCGNLCSFLEEVMVM